jgi:hypothetical protein
MVMARLPAPNQAARTARPRVSRPRDRSEVAVFPDLLAADQHVAHDGRRTVDHLVVVEHIAVQVLARVVAVPGAQLLGVDEHDVGLGADLDGADVQVEELRRFPGQAPDHPGDGRLAPILGQLERHQVGVEESHVGDVRSRVVEARQRLRMEQVVERGPVALVRHVGPVAEALVIATHQPEHEIRVVARPLLAGS